VPRTLSRRSSRQADPDYGDEKGDGYLDERDDRPARGSRRGDRSDTADEAPARGSRRNRFTDDEPEDEPTSAARDDEPEDRPPRRGERASRSSRREEPTDAKRGGRSERRSGSKDGGRGQRGDADPAKQGWGGYRQTADSIKSDFADNLKIVDNTDMLIKIADTEPVAAYAEHWLTIDGKRRSFVCLGANCPLCDRLGDRPTVKVAMNVIDMDANPPEVKIWQFGTQVGDILEKFADNPKTSPVNRDDLYWTITRTKKADRYTTTVRPVKARDLVEDFDTDPLTDAELDELEQQLFTQDQVFTIKSRAELIKVIEDNDLEDQY
jgi:hypothetical protein